jgi:septal ring factor EnvC (AmiA/AmiB activator)
MRSFLFSKKKYFAVFLSMFLFLSLFLFAFNSASALTPAEQEAAWRAELEQTEKDIAHWQDVLNNTKQGTASLQKEAAILNAKIQQAKAFIKQKNIAIAALQKDIATKNAHISVLEKRIEQNHDSLAQIIRKSNEIDSYSLPEVVLGNQNISDFFSDVSTFQSINREMAVLFEQIRENKNLTEKEKAALDAQKNKETDTRIAAEAERKQVEKNEKEKEYLIQVNKTKEKTYAQVLADRQKRAAEIRAALFALRDSAAIPFGDALKYAEEASAKTGVRVAFLLAVITQESDLGKNQGSCLVNNISTGDGAGKNTGNLFEKVMKAPRDTVPFESITSRLGKDWKMTPVSCPPGAKYTSTRGYGGGMGPSQFIPSTWELFKDRLGTILGIPGDQVNPWNPRDAFMATALYMQDLGAVSGSYSAERNAACKYYSGSSCSTTRKPPNAFYGDQVLAKATSIQQNMIDPLSL